MSPVRTIHGFPLKFAISIYSRIAGADKSNALLLSKRAKSRSTALVWSLEFPEQARDAKLEEMERHLSAFHTVVVVSDANSVSSILAKGFRAEVLPSKQEQQTHFCDLPWQTYLTRRISRIRNCWVPDFEFILKTAPEDFVIDKREGPLVEVTDVIEETELEYSEDYAS
ncbi:MAG: hypothetical protein K5905_02560 [Roseibium sp.]|uniref:hypothetical protein n=1 Tax=Roseibium sp. TaxID=1936156 RepID=UPI002616AE9C|nr:hypothetical protein [Roseibium sp.]MCV0424331.1 hypothetical protein [Roseibium sp.]